MLNERNRFIKEVGLDGVDGFDISLISDKVKRQNISNNGTTEKYRLIPEIGEQCIIERSIDDDSILYYKSDGGSHMIQNGPRTEIIQNTVTEEIYTPDEESYNVIPTHRIVSDGKIIKDSKILFKDDSRTDEITKDGLYRVTDSMIEDDKIYTIRMDVSKTEYSQIKDVSIFECVPLGIWSSKVYHLDRRLIREYRSDLYYKEYFYNNSNRPIGYIEFDPSRNTINNIKYIDGQQHRTVRDIISGNGVEYKNKNIIRIIPSDEPKNYNLPKYNIELDGGRHIVKTKAGSYNTISDKITSINEYSDGGKSMSIYHNNSDILYNYEREPFHTIWDPYQVDLNKYTSYNIINSGKMAMYRLDGILQMIKVVSLDRYKRLDEYFMFDFGSKMVEIKQYYYENNILGKVNII